MGSCASVHKEDVGLPKKLSLALSLPSKVDLKRKIKVFGPSSRSVDSASLVPGSMDSLQKKNLDPLWTARHIICCLGVTMAKKTLFVPVPRCCPAIQFEASRSHDIDGIHQSWILRHLDGP
nr:uncharacterized protein LOC109772440 [Aegilops tauschii subsp. strangulata]